MIAMKKKPLPSPRGEGAPHKLRRANEQLHALTSHLQYVLEEERIRIAREVHDELGQRLTGLKLDLAWLGRKLSAPGQGPLRDKVRDLSDAIDGTIQIVRRIATELRPQILDDIGLMAAIEWEVGEFQKRSLIRCKVVSRAGEIIQDQDFTTVFFRVLQETLTNILRHAEASRVEVRVTGETDQLVLEVRDNGRGIAAEEIASTRSIGLIGMRERAALVGGEIVIHGAPGKGTIVRLRAPLPRPVRIAR